MFSTLTALISSIFRPSSQLFLIKKAIKSALSSRRTRWETCTYKSLLQPHIHININKHMDVDFLVFFVTFFDTTNFDFLFKNIFPDIFWPNIFLLFFPKHIFTSLNTFFNPTLCALTHNYDIIFDWQCLTAETAFVSSWTGRCFLTYWLISLISLRKYCNSKNILNSSKEKQNIHSVVSF